MCSLIGYSIYMFWRVMMAHAAAGYLRMFVRAVCISRNYSSQARTGKFNLASVAVLIICLKLIIYLVLSSMPIPEWLVERFHLWEMKLLFSTLSPSHAELYHSQLSALWGVVLSWFFPLHFFLQKVFFGEVFFHGHVGHMSKINYVFSWLTPIMLYLC